MVRHTFQVLVKRQVSDNLLSVIKNFALYCLTKIAKNKYSINKARWYLCSFTIIILHILKTQIQLCTDYFC